MARCRRWVCWRPGMWRCCPGSPVSWKAAHRPSPPASCQNPSPPPFAPRHTQLLWAVSPRDVQESSCCLRMHCGTAFGLRTPQEIPGALEAHMSPVLGQQPCQQLQPLSGECALLDCNMVAGSSETRSIDNALLSSQDLGALGFLAQLSNQLSVGQRRGPRRHRWTITGGAAHGEAGRGLPAAANSVASEDGSSASFRTSASGVRREMPPTDVIAFMTIATPTASTTSTSSAAPQSHSQTRPHPDARSQAGHPRPLGQHPHPHQQHPRDPHPLLPPPAARELYEDGLYLPPPPYPSFQQLMSKHVGGRGV
eukprot:XP_001702249.1 predicted protein [Chlamydomonas reinhardtii]